MPEQSFQDKTEPATPKRREDARKKGQVGKSREIPSVAVMGAGLIFFLLAGKKMTLSLGSMMQTVFRSIPSISSGDLNIVILGMDYLRFYMLLLFPVMLVLSVVALLSNVVQTGLIWSVEPLAPKASKINPVEGAKRIFSKRSLVELAKSIAKIIIVGWAAFSVLKGELDHLIQLTYQGKAQIMSYLAYTSIKVVGKSCVVIALLAILDYMYQKWEFEQSLKMTKQEVKDEFKQTEGDPLVKSRIKAIQREMARRRMMEEVKTADVVITNPSHLSVALRYDSMTMNAPKVVAKGADRIAFKIREVAKDHGIPLVENRSLAQNLYKSVDIGEEIPSSLYQAVAEILAYVYRLKGRTG
ncbi:MAG: flagellar biosynthesis protein FlhB [Deltaproteobacteria bacterium]|nr:flagellar biosynthesis protein FlhB [Deltaproteobacteria bacterium]MBW1928490.1 flagellar biosynthesis protein FlhB [Deltaproteobacteria bacterium]MBW2024176.1 flagellar biosynthesis protein FlhB [Deltaproteobacteria bacterium]MBW2125799.1 flagellar biosynthesis protein FlhB [Deltaproteobacteria bacterium]RLB22919.1 MAG: flagellar biosynthesis protein FlhB [Deltaproteobacteria bacterium]